MSFLGRPEIKSIHLVDPSIDVINTLKKKLVDSYITEQEFIKLHWKKGQDLVLNPEPKTVFIAGMGGKEMGEIIVNLLPQLSSADRLVISPHRNILELRKYLHSTELGIVDEVCLKEDGQYYQILCLVKDSSLRKVSFYGESLWQSEVGEEYRQHQIRTFSQHQDSLSQAFVTHLKQLSC